MGGSNTDPNPNMGIKATSVSTKDSPTTYATKLSPTVNVEKANFWKLEAIVPEDAHYDLDLPIASVHEVNGKLKNSLYGYFIGERLAFHVV